MSPYKNHDINILLAESKFVNDLYVYDGGMD